MTVTLYRDSSGNTISTAVLMDMDPPIQGFSIENYHEAKEVKQTWMKKSALYPVSKS